MYNIVCDTCFWFGLLSPRDDYHLSALKIYEELLKNPQLRFIIPFPSLYETLNTAFCSNKTAMERFNEIVRDKAEYVYDDSYREEAFEQAMSQENISGRHFSLVDIIIRMIIEDNNVRKDAIITSNIRDFYDYYGKIEILQMIANHEMQSKGR